MTNIELLKTMFRTTQDFDLGYSKNVSVDVDDFLSNPNSFFAGNSFDTIEDFRKYISDIKKLGATNIRVTGFLIDCWTREELTEMPYGDTLVFNTPNENYNKIKDVYEVDETDNYQLKNGRGDYKNTIRFWWD